LRNDPLDAIDLHTAVLPLQYFITQINNFKFSTVWKPPQKLIGDE
jgi:hypothetical protein